ncbi:MAG: hypothetical protein U9P71_08880 [Campylobacterota bacterium]|nr:hypothetical protein [Campylobacterota bacterium]
MQETYKINYKRIIKDCFWDVKMTPSDVDAIVSSGDWHRKTLLFEKILLNSTRMLVDLSVFQKDDLILLIEGFKVPTFNYDYIFRRKNIAEVYFLNKPLEIDELKWIA